MDGISLTASTSALSPVALFLQADIVVKAVMVGLLLASVFTWTIILGNGFKIGSVFKRSKAFEAEFWKSEDIDRIYDGTGRQDVPSAKVFSAGVAEWRRSVRDGKPVDREGTRARLATAMASAAATEIDKLSDRLNILATIGSVAPFVGLFGTVWGIYHALLSIGAAGQATIDKVAGPIGESLIMTALGLAVAIPAVLGYNALVRGNKGVLQKLSRFAHDLHAYFVTGARIGPGGQVNVVPMKKA
jgi:biopolymer transport protein TolQ